MGASAMAERVGGLEKEDSRGTKVGAPAVKAREDRPAEGREAQARVEGAGVGAAREDRAEDKEAQARVGGAGEDLGTAVPAS